MVKIVTKMISWISSPAPSSTMYLEFLTYIAREFFITLQALMASPTAKFNEYVNQ